MIGKEKTNIMFNEKLNHALGIKYRKIIIKILIQK